MTVEVDYSTFVILPNAKNVPPGMTKAPSEESRDAQRWCRWEPGCRIKNCRFAHSETDNKFVPPQVSLANQRPIYNAASSGIVSCKTKDNKVTDVHPQYLQNNDLQLRSQSQSLNMEAFNVKTAWQRREKEFKMKTLSNKGRINNFAYMGPRKTGSPLLSTYQKLPNSLDYNTPLLPPQSFTLGVPSPYSEPVHHGSTLIPMVLSNSMPPSNSGFPVNNFSIHKPHYVPQLHCDRYQLFQPQHLPKTELTA